MSGLRTRQRTARICAGRSCFFTHRDDATRACDAAARVQAGAMLTRHWRVHPVKPEKIQSLEVRRTDPIKLSTEQQKMPDKTIN
eukprot:COSAG06_NODE_5646_length_3344_cov_2.474576_3_plen_84_part_00